MIFIARCLALAGIGMMILGFAAESTLMTIPSAALAVAALIGLQILEEDDYEQDG